MRGASGRGGVADQVEDTLLPRLSIADGEGPGEGAILYLIRHAAAAGQAPDAPLTAEGEQQAARLAAWLEGSGITRLVSSPFVRARQTAAPLAVRLGLLVETDNRLMERVLCAEPLADWRAALRATFDDPDLRFPGGESSGEALARGLAAVRNALDGRAGAVAVVTHGNLLALVLRHLDARFGFADWEQLRNPEIICAPPEVLLTPSRDWPADGPRWHRIELDTDAAEPPRILNL